jgi:hypothetical protein
MSSLRRKKPLQRKTALKPSGPIARKKKPEAVPGFPSKANRPRKGSRPGAKSLTNKNDRIAGLICRSAGCCQASNWAMHSTEGEMLTCGDQLQWCHVYTRKYKAIRWDERNCVCMCATHHMYFTMRPLEFASFMESIRPGTETYLRERMREPFKCNVAYLLSELERLTALAKERGVEF